MKERIAESRHIKRWETDPERRDTLADRKQDVQRAVQDVGHEDFTEQMDLSAQDNHMKYERPSFSVVGEQTKSSNEKYAEGYERIDWTK